MTLASILRNSGGTDLVVKLSPLPTRCDITRNLFSVTPHNADSPPFVSSTRIHYPFRERKRQVPL